MTQWAAPTSDISVSGWTDQADGTTDLYSTIDEDYTAATALDYVESPAATVGATAVFGFGGVYTPKSGTVTLYIRAQWGDAEESGTSRTFVWDAVGGADEYRLQQSPDSSSWTTRFAGLALTSTITVATGTHYFRVGAFASGSALSYTTPETVTVP